MQHKIISYNEFEKSGYTITAVESSGLDLVLKTSEGDIIVQNGLSSLVSSQGSVKLGNGSSVSYKSLISDLISNEDAIKVLDTTFLGDVYSKSGTDDVGVIVPGVEKGAKVGDKNTTAKIIKQISQAEEVKAAEESVDESKKAQDQIAELKKQLEKAKTEANLAESEAKEVATESAEKQTQKEQSHNKHLDEMKNELKVQQPDNDNTSKLKGEYLDEPKRVVPVIPSSSGSDVEEKVDEYDFSASLKGTSDSGVKSDFITNVKEPVVVGAGTPSSTVSLTVNGEIIKAVVDSSGSWTVNLSSMKDGSYDFVAKESTGKTVSKTLIIDTKNTLSSDLDNDTGVSGDHITKENSLHFVGKSDAGATVTVVVNGHSYSSVAKDDGSWSVKCKDALPDGKFDCTVTSVDVAGNEVSERMTVVVDTVAKGSMALEKASDSGVSSSDMITNVKKDLGFAGDVEDGATATLTFNGKEYPIVVSGGHWTSVIDSSLDDGDYNAVLHIVDVAGNERDIAHKIVIDTHNTITTQLSFETDTGSSSTDGITKVNKPVFVGEGEPNSIVSLTIDSVTYKSVVDSEGKYSIEVVNGLNDATYNYSVKSVDVAGNVATVSGKITVDRGISLTTQLDKDTGLSSSDGITRESQNSISGKTEVGAILKIFSDSIDGINGTQIKVGSDGSYKFDLPALKDGTYEYTVLARDAAGNEIKQTRTVVIDTKTTVDGGLDESTDTGVSSVDGCTSAAPIFKGVGEIGAEVTVVIGGKEYKQVVKSDGQWSIPITNELAEGKHIASISIIDAAGNTKSADSVQINIDRTAPSTYSISLNNDSGVGKSDWITKNGNLDLSGNIDAGSFLTISIAGVKYTTANGLKVNKDGSWSLKLAESLGDGDYRIDAVVSDIAGNSSLHRQSVTVNTDISVTGKIASESDTGLFDDDAVTRETSPIFKGRSEIGSKVVIFIDGEKFEVDSDPATGDWQFKCPHVLKDGNHTASYEATDIAGNKLATKLESFTIDTVAPSRGSIILRNDTGDDTGDFKTKETRPSFGGVVEKGCSLELIITDSKGNESIYTSASEIQIDKNGSWSFVSPTVLPEGEYKVVFREKDLAGNVTEISKNMSIDISISLTSELKASDDTGTSSFDSITKITTPTLHGTGDAGDTVTLSINGHDYHTSVKSDGKWEITVKDPLPSSALPHEYKVTATDLVGNRKEIEGKILVDTSTHVTVSLTSESDSGIIDAKTNKHPVFEGSGEEGSHIVLTLNNKVYEADVDSSGKWEISVSSNLPDGKYDADVVATDVAGNTKNASCSIEIDTKTSISGQLDLSSDSGSDNRDFITNVKTPKFSGMAEADAEVIVTIDNHEYSTKANDKGIWSITVTNELKDKHYDVKIKSTDEAGNEATSDATVTVDTANFVTSSLSRSSDSGASSSDLLTKIKEPVFEGRGEEGSLITLTINEHQYTTTVGKDGSWKISNVSELADGTYAVSVSSKDIAGNDVSADSFNVEIDSKAPTFIKASLKNDSGVSSHDFITKNDRPVFIGKVDDATTEIKLTINGTTYTQPDVIVSADGTWEFKLPSSLAESPDPYKYNIEYKDLAGNTSREVGSVIIDKTNSVDISLDEKSDSGVKDDSITRDSKPNFKGHTEAGADIVVTVGGNTYSTKADDKGDFNVKVDHVLSDGDFLVEVTSTDVAGNKRESSTNITIDTTPIPLDQINLLNDSGKDGKDWVTKSNTPHFSGILEDGATLEIIIKTSTGNMSLISGKDFVIGKDGSWDCKWSKELDDASYDVKFKATDTAGNVSVGEKHLVIDTSIKVGGSLDSTSDTGVSNTDGETSVNQPLFTGKTDPDSLVNIEVNGKNYSTQSASDGSWSIKVTDILPDGSYPVNIIATDAAGNTKAIPTFNVLVDTKPPAVGEVVLVSDSGKVGDNITNSKDFLVFEGSVDKGCSIVFKFNNQVFKEPDVVISADGKWTLKVPAPSQEVQHDWVMEVSDRAGNTSTKNGAIAIDRTTTVDGHLSESSDSGSSHSDGVTNSQNIVFEGAAEKGSTVSVVINKKTYTSDVDKDGKWSITVGESLSTGKYHYDISSKDLAGNVATKSGTIEVDRVQPTINVDLVNDSADKTDWISNNNRPVIGGVAENDSEVSIVLDGVTYGSNLIPVDPVTGKWMFVAPTSLRDGTFDVVIKNVDKAGNVTEEHQSLVIDTHAVVSGGMADASDSGEKDSITNVTKPVFAGLGDKGASVVLTVDGVDYKTTVGADGKWSISLGEMIEGKHKFTLSLSDTAGNNSNVEHGTFVIDTVSELTGGLSSKSDSGESDSDKYTKVKAPQFEGSAEAGSKIVVTVDGKSINSTADSNGHWSLVWGEDISDGSHKLAIKATDVTGNVAVKESDFTIDTVAPTKPSVTLLNDTGDDKTDFITKNNHPELGGVISSGEKVVLTISNVTYQSPDDIKLVSNSDGTVSWSFKVPHALTDDTYDFTLKVVDRAGNDSQTTGSVVVDTSGSLSFNLSAGSDSGVKNDDKTQSGTPVFVGSADPFSIVTIHINNHDYSTKSDKYGKWSLKVTDDLAHGDYKYTIKSKDAAGNEVEKQSSITIDKETEVSGGVSAKDDTGKFSNDGVTKLKDLHLSGEGEKGSELTITIDAKEYTLKVDEYGKWSFKIPVQLDAGEHDYTIKIVDQAGNEKTIPGTISVDDHNFLNIMLAAKDDTGTSSTDYYTNVGRPMFKGTTEKGNTVTVIMNGGTYDVPVNASGAWEFRPPYVLREGETPFEIKSVDLAGNEVVKSGVLTLDTKTSVSVTLDASTDTGISHTDGVTKHDKPMLSGNGEPNAELIVIVDKHTYKTTVGSDGRWSVVIGEKLVDGKYKYSVEVIDKAGNHRVEHGELEIDRHVSFDGGISPSSDTGKYSNDYLTFNTKPTFVGNGDAGSIVELSINNKVYSTTVGADGKWSVSVENALSSNDFKFELTITDPAGNVDSKSGVLSIDTSTHVSADFDSNGDTGISDTDNITKNATPTITGVTDKGASVELILDGVSHDVVVHSDGTWSFSVVGDLTDGEHEYQVKAIDVAGNKAETPPVKFVVDTKTSVDGGIDTVSDTGDSKSDGVTKDNTPEITGSAEKGSIVTVVLNGKTYETKADDNDKWKVVVKDAIPDGDYTIFVKSVDVAGNEAKCQQKVHFDTKITLTSSMVSDTGVDKESMRDGVTNIVSPIFKGNGEFGTSVVITVNNKEFKTNVLADGTWSIELPDKFSEGVYKYKITTEDVAGNKLENAGSFTIDTKVEMTAILANDSANSSDGISHNNTPIFSGTGENGAVITLVINKKTYSTTVSGKTWKIEIPASDALNDGDYVASLSTTDRANNHIDHPDMKITIDTVNVVTIVLDSASDTGRSSSDAITSDKTPLVSGDFEKGASIEIIIDGTKHYTINNGIVVTANGKWSLQIPNDSQLEEGNHTVTVVSTDVAGTVAKDNLNLVVDSKAPAGSTVRFTSGTSSVDGLSKDKKATFSGHAEKDAQIIVEVDGIKQSGFVAVKNNGSWDYKYDKDLTDGTHSFTFVIYDAAGNKESISKVVNIDTGTTVSAKLDTSMDLGGSKTDGITSAHENIIISGLGEAGASIKLNINGAVFNATVSKGGTWEINVGSLDGGKPDGVLYDYDVIATDLAGNQKTVHGKLTVDTVDPDQPTVSIVAASDSATKGDWKTNAKEVVIAGGANPKDTIVVLVDGSSHKMKNSNGSWSLDLGEIKDGLHKISVITEDIAGNKSQVDQVLDVKRTLSVDGSVTHDNDTGTDRADGITKYHRPEMSGLTNPDALVKVVISGKDGDIEFNVTAGKDGKWEIANSDYSKYLQDGIYNVSITASDAYGNSASHKITIHVDSTIDISAKLDETSNTGIVKSDNLTIDESPRISGKVLSNKDFVRVEILDSKGSVVEIINASVQEDGKWFVDPSTKLTDGTYTAHAVVSDIAGNEKVSDVKFTVDLTPPKNLNYALTASTNTGAADDLTTQVRKPTLHGVVEKGCSVTVVVDGHTYNARVEKDGRWTCEITDNLTDGELPFDVIAKDAAGNKLTKSDKLVIDNKNSLHLEFKDGEDTGISKTDGNTKDDTPVVEGKTDSWSVITISAMVDGNHKSFEHRCGEDGKFSFSLGDLNGAGMSLSDGTYDFVVSSKDVSGNEAVYKKTVVIDTKNPTNLSLSLDDESNSASKKDMITNVKNPVLVGTAEFGCNVIIKIDGKPHNVSVASDGKWSFSSADLSEGSHKVVVTALDKAGNMSRVEKTIQIDTTDPTDVKGHLSTLSETGAWIDGITSKKSGLVLEGSCEVGCTLNVIIEGVTYPAVVRSDGKWVVTTTATFSDGVHKVELVATDVAGNVTKGKYFTFEVDSTKPEISKFEMSHNPDNDTGKSHDDGLTKNATPEFSGRVGLDVAFVKMVVDGGESFDGVINPDGTFTVQTTGFSDGVYTYHIEATDRAGNVTKTSSKSFTIDGTNDLKVSLTSATDSGISHTDGITNSDVPAFNVSTDSGNRVSMVIKDKGGKVVYRETKTLTSPDYEWQLSNATFDDGRYKYEFTSTDEAGNRLTKTGTMVIDRESHISGGLSVSSDTGIKGDSKTNSKNPIFSGVAEAGSTVTLHVDATFADGFVGVRTYKVTADNSGNWKIPVTDSLKEGEYTYRAEAVDKAGNNTETLGGGTSGKLIVDLTRPTVGGGLVSDSGDDPSDRLTHGIDSGANAGKIKFSGSSHGAHIIEILLNGQTYKANVDYDGKWELVIPDHLPDKKHDALITAVDDAGNRSASIKETFWYDSKIIISASIEDNPESDSGKIGDDITNIKKPKLAGTCEDGLSISISIQGDNGIKIDVPEFTSKNGNWKVDLGRYSSGLKDGTYDVVLNCRDKAGNTGSNNYHFTVDTTPPNLSIHKYHGETEFQGAPRIRGVAEAYSKVVLEIGGKILTTNALSDGSFKFNPAVLPKLGDGSNDYTIRAYDKAGNMSTDSDSVKVDSGTFVTGNLNYKDDTGTLNTDGITQCKNPTFLGSTEAGSEVVVKIYRADGTLYMSQTGTPKSNGQFEIKFDGKHTLADGDYKYVIENKDMSGNVAKTDALELRIDNSLVVSKIDAFTDWSDRTGTTYGHERFLGKNTGNFKGVLANAEYGASINVKVGNKEFKGFSDNKGTFNVAWSLPDGRHIAHVTIIDPAGNKVEQDIVMNVDAKVKEDFSFECSNNQMSTMTNIHINEKILHLKGRCDVDDHTTVRVQLMGSEKTMNFNARVKDGHWSIDEAVPDGVYTFEYWYTEKSGAYVWGRGQLSVDTKNEQLTVDKIEKNEVDGNWVSSKISGFAEYGATIEVTIGGKHYKTVAKEGGVWSIDADINANKSFDIEIVSTDRSNNVIKWTDHHSGKIKLDLFDSIKTDFGDNAVMKNGGLTGEAPEGAIVKIVCVNAFGDTKNLYAVSGSNGKWAIDTTSLADGKWSLDIHADTDWSHITKKVSIVLDNLPPVVLEADIDGMTDLGYVSSKKAVIHGKGDIGTFVEVTIDGHVYKSKVNADGKWSITADALSEGNHNYVVKGIDGAGNERELAKRDFIVDTKPPKADMVIDGAVVDADGKLSVGDDTPVIKGHVSTTNLKGLTVLVDDVPYVSGKDFVIAKDGSWEIQVRETLDEGRITVALEAVGKNGLKSSDSIKVRVDVTPPDAKLVDDFSNDKHEISGTCGKGDSVKIVIDGKEYSADVKEKTWSFDAKNILHEGDHHYSVIATDIVGNEQVVKKMQELVIDHSAPNATVDSVPSIVKEIALTGNADDAAKVLVSIDGKDPVEAKIANGKWSLPSVHGLVDGQHHYSITAIDAHGNKAVVVKDASVTTDSTAPVLLTVGVDGVNVKAGGSLDVNGDVVSLGGTIDVDDVFKVSVNIAGVTYVSGVDFTIDTGTGAWSLHDIDISSVKGMKSEVTVVETGSNGMSSDLSVTLIPSKHDIAPVDGKINTPVSLLSLLVEDNVNITEDNLKKEVVFSGVSKTMEIIEISCDGHIIGETSVKPSGEWSVVMKHDDISGMRVKTTGVDSEGHEISLHEQQMPNYDSAKAMIEISGVADPMSDVVILGGDADHTVKAAADGSWKTMVNEDADLVDLVVKEKHGGVTIESKVEDLSSHGSDNSHSFHGNSTSAYTSNDFSFEHDADNHLFS
ncbi:Ig-like domain-containing protein [Photobacterium kishitanii]|uniref:Ig-like domain repeat protein n=1 Tax=Photobacterium kishitanii TaxID=318456 RepID=A0A2T3KM66_9GAMM|nr:Ig-like domain-containing protein [Photobacterium kishitanii]PSV00881.1 hypothetical protein C9J27_02310 [Photobacterium kishitanii]